MPKLTSVRTLSELIAYKAQLPRDELTMAGLDRAVIEIQMIVRRECADMVAGCGDGAEAHGLILDVATDEHQRDQPIARAHLHGLIGYRPDQPSR